MDELAVMETPPLRVVLGSVAYQMVIRKLESYKENCLRFEQLSNGTEVDGYEGRS